MHPYALIDLHCDTLIPCQDFRRPENTLDDPQAQLSLSSLPRGVRWGQCFAVFIPDALRGPQAAGYYALHQRSFVRQMELFCARVSPCRCPADLERAWACGKTAAILTVENGSALAGDLGRVELLARDGVKAVTLTWNGENELGSGNATGHGLSGFGRAAVAAMEKHGILADVSHLNDRGFWELMDVARRPFLATHSNARSVCPHPRNLTDGQIREMAGRGCLIGLNYADGFLRQGGNAAPEDLLRHVEHFLALGAEDCLALGSDFDGAALPSWLDSPEKAAGLYGRLLGWGLPPALCDKLLYRNALDFFRANLGPG